MIWNWRLLSWTIGFACPNSHWDGLTTMFCQIDGKLVELTALGCISLKWYPYSTQELVKPSSKCSVETHVTQRNRGKTKSFGAGIYVRSTSGDDHVFDNPVGCIGLMDERYFCLAYSFQQLDSCRHIEWGCPSERFHRKSRSCANSAQLPIYLPLQLPSRIWWEI